MNFFNLPIEEQRAVVSSATHNANKEQTEALRANYDKVMIAKEELMAVINDILGTKYDAKDKLIFSMDEREQLQVSTNNDTPEQ